MLMGISKIDKATCKLGKIKRSKREVDSETSHMQMPAPRTALGITVAATRYRNREALIGQVFNEFLH